MKPLRYLEKRIRGWLPKEPGSSRVLLRLKAFRTKIRQRKPPTERERLVGGLGGGGGALVLIGIMNYFSFPRYPMSFIIIEEAVGSSLVALALSIWLTDKSRKINAKKSSPKDQTNRTANSNVPQMASQEKVSARFVTREANWLVMTPGVLALLNFFIFLRGILLYGQKSSITSLSLVMFGILAFLMLVLHPAATKIKVTKDGIDWKMFGIGIFIHYDDLKEIRVGRFCLKLDMGKWRTICPVNRNGFLMAVREAKPDLQITGWKH